MRFAYLPARYSFSIGTLKICPNFLLQVQVFTLTEVTSLDSLRLQNQESIQDSVSVFFLDLKLKDDKSSRL